MSPEEFVAALRQVVFDSAVDDVLALLHWPADKALTETLGLVSRWFDGLSPADEPYVRFIAREAAHSALFGVLAVLDGARAFDDQPHGELHLQYIAADGTETRINLPGAELHDELNALVHPMHEPLDRA